MLVKHFCYVYYVFRFKNWDRFMGYCPDLPIFKYVAAT